MNREKLFESECVAFQELRTLLANPDAWMQAPHSKHMISCDVNGEPVGPTSEAAVKFHILGAIKRVLHNTRVTSASIEISIRDVVRKRTRNKFADIHEYQNSSATHAELLAVIDEADELNRAMFGLSNCTPPKCAEYVKVINDTYSSEIYAY